MPTQSANGVSDGSLFAIRELTLGSAARISGDLGVAVDSKRGVFDTNSDFTIGMLTLCRFEWMLDLDGGVLWLIPKPASVSQDNMLKGE